MQVNTNWSKNTNQFSLDKIPLTWFTLPWVLMTIKVVMNGKILCTSITWHRCVGEGDRSKVAKRRVIGADPTPTKDGLHQQLGVLLETISVEDRICVVSILSIYLHVFFCFSPFLSLSLSLPTWSWLWTCCHHSYCWTADIIAVHSATTHRGQKLVYGPFPHENIQN